MMHHALKDAFDPPRLQEAKFATIANSSHDISMDEQSDVERLIAILDDRDPELRRSAAQSLAAIGSDRAVDALIHHIADPDVNLRRMIILALEACANPRAIEPLAALIPDEDIMASRMAIIALDKIGSDAAKLALADAYMRLREEQEQHVSLRHDILKVLRNSPVPITVDALAVDLREFEDPWERLTILQALGSAARLQGSETAIRTLVDSLAEPSQRHVTIGDQNTVWRTAAEGLAYVAMSTQAVTLLHCLIDNPPAADAVRATDYLARILVEHIALTDASFWNAPPADGRGVGEVCARALDQKAACTRLAAVCVLARIPAFVSHHLLVRALYDDDAQVVLAALHVLGGRTGLKDIQPIHRLLHDRRTLPPIEGWSGKSVSESAERALIRIDTDDAREVLAMWRQRRRS